MKVALNEDKMLGFRIPMDVEQPLRVFFSRNNVGARHVLQAFCEKLASYDDFKSMEYEMIFIRKIIARAREIKEINFHRAATVTTVEKL